MIHVRSFLTPEHESAYCPGICCSYIKKPSADLPVRKGRCRTLPPLFADRLAASASVTSSKSYPLTGINRDSLLLSWHHGMSCSSLCTNPPLNPIHAFSSGTGSEATFRMPSFKRPPSVSPQPPSLARGHPYSSSSLPLSGYYLKSSEGLLSRISFTFSHPGNAARGCPVSLRLPPPSSALRSTAPALPIPRCRSPCRSSSRDARSPAGTGRLPPAPR